MAQDRSAVVNRLERRLVSDATPSGWGYYPGKSSRIEPTCWALLALSNRSRADAGVMDIARPGLAFLLSCQAADGLLSDTEPALTNFTANGLAAVVLTDFAAQAPAHARKRLISALAAVKGVQGDYFDPKQDNKLQAWPWVRDTFSWIEPTAWCLMALKKAEPSQRNVQVMERVAEAEKLMRDRVCATGGWNYGNASAVGQDLRAYVPTTAVGLLSMQDRRTDPPVARSFDWLVQQSMSERGTLTLSLVSICLSAFGLPTDELDEAIISALGTSERSGNIQAIAAAAYALSAGDHRVEALRVTG